MTVSILVVDDESDVAELFRQRFRREVRQGTYAMHFANSGAEGLDKLVDRKMRCARSSTPIAPVISRTCWRRRRSDADYGETGWRTCYGGDQFAASSSDGYPPRYTRYKAARAMTIGDIEDD